MFSAKVKDKVSGAGSVASRARDASVAAAKAAASSSAAQSAAAAAQNAAQTAAQGAATAAQSAAQGVNSAAQTAAANVSKGVKQGVFGARGWAAPRLESAADYVTATAGPKVSSALRATAKQVSPPDTRRSKLRSALTWSVLGAAVLAAAGAAGVMVRKRYQAAMAADTELDTAEGAANSPDTKGDSTGTASASKDAGVNGRVSASGW